MLLQLTPTMEKKLKHLTILSLAIQKKTLLYDDLMAELDIKNVRDLEDLIIEAIYAGLLLSILLLTRMLKNVYF